MPEMIKQKCFNWPVNKRDMGSQKIPHISPMKYNICIEKLPTAATVHFL